MGSDIVLVTKSNLFPKRLALQRLYKKVQISVLSIFQLLGFLTPLAFGQISSGISFLIQHLIGFQFSVPEKQIYCNTFSCFWNSSILVVSHKTIWYIK